MLVSVMIYVVLYTIIVAACGGYMNAEIVACGVMGAIGMVPIINVLVADIREEMGK